MIRRALAAGLKAGMFMTHEFSWVASGLGLRNFVGSPRGFAGGSLDAELLHSAAERVGMQVE